MRPALQLLPTGRLAVGGKGWRQVPVLQLPLQFLQLLRLMLLLPLLLPLPRLRLLILLLAQLVELLQGRCFVCLLWQRRATVDECHVLQQVLQLVLVIQQPQHGGGVEPHLRNGLLSLRLPPRLQRHRGAPGVGLRRLRPQGDYPTRFLLRPAPGIRKAPAHLQLNIGLAHGAPPRVGLCVAGLQPLREAGAVEGVAAGERVTRGGGGGTRLGRRRRSVIIATA